MDRLTWKNAAWAVFAAYCALMLWLLFDRSGYTPELPYPEQLKYNLRPFETIGLFWDLLDSADPGYRRMAVVNLAGNVVMFIPLGFFLPLLWEKKRKLWKTLLTAALIITAVELIQLLTLVGSCDTDDLILNVLGAAVGYGLFRLLCGRRNAQATE